MASTTKNAQQLFPAADLSEPISTAGKAASGTDNMKFGMNGAITIGTFDGETVEIREEVGEGNFSILGLTAGEMEPLQARGYRPRDCYKQDTELSGGLDFIASGALSLGNANLFRPLAENLLKSDPFLVLADYQVDIECQEKVSALWRDENAWMRQSILNTARMGKVSSDRAIRDYCAEVWSISAGGQLPAA